MSDEKVQVSHLVPEHTRDAAKSNAEHGELSEKVRVLYESIAFGEDIGERSQIERELQSVRSEKDDIRKEIRELQADLESLEKREARLEERVSNLSSKEDKYEGAIEMLEEQLYNGTRVDPNHGGVKRAAGLTDAKPEAVIKTLKERNPNIPDHAFKQKMYTSQEWNGMPEEAARDED